MQYRVRVTPLFNHAWRCTDQYARRALHLNQRIRLHGSDISPRPPQHEKELQIAVKFNSRATTGRLRFFRDGISFGLYERKLQKHGVKVVSITQQTSDDSSGHARERPAGFLQRLGSAVREIFRIYMDGHGGRTLGIKEIAKHLNATGQTMRGRPWGIQKVHKILSSRTYAGEYLFNVRDSRTHQKRPPADWIRVPIDPIIDEATFERVRQRRQARAPATTLPRRVSSPVLLTRLLKCGDCGGAMTLTTGKSGKYRYYKCTTRVNKGGTLCTSRNLSMERVDNLVLQQLTAHAFTPKRLGLLLREARRQIQDRKSVEQRDLERLQAEVRKCDDRLARLYDAIERVLPSQVELFSRVIRAKLHDRASPFAQDYLHALVDQITVYEDTATIMGSNAKLLRIVGGKKGPPIKCPVF